MYTIAVESGVHAKHPPPNPRATAGCGAVVTIRSGPPASGIVTIADADSQRTVNASLVPSGEGRGSPNSRPDRHISTVITKSPCYVSTADAKPLWNDPPPWIKITENLSEPERKERPMRMTLATCGMPVAAVSRPGIVDVIAA